MLRARVFIGHRSVLLRLAWIFGAIQLLWTPTHAETDPMEAPLQVVQFGEQDTLRGVVGNYLKDPDLWPTVLALNNIASPADLTPGTELRLPVRQVFAADEALLASLKAIQKANAEGARIFAPDEIGNALENRDAAVRQREIGEWRQVVSYAGVARDFAKEALDISIEQRDRSAEAVVSDVQGDVEGRAPVEPSWSGRDLNDILIEFERVRTLSSSTTQITFRDLSRLRLNPNSNATIQRMRSDPLTGGEVTKVSLANGDFYALLNQLSEKTTFEIEVPGIETTTNSADFWIKNDQSGARFVNYDTPGLEIEQDGQKIMLGENEGVVISGRGAQRAAVLQSPRLVTPTMGQILYSKGANLSWDVFEGAEGYWLEIASDPGFNQMQVSEWGIRETAFVAADLTPARYHWRVAALDKLGLPGEWSTPQEFTLRVDTTLPFLTLLSPATGTIETTPTVEVLGATELDAQLMLNDQPVEVGADGSFLLSVALVPGENAISVQATDPAGNQSTRSHLVVYRPAKAIEIVLDAGIARVGDALATRSKDLSVLAETTAADATVVVRDQTGDIVVRTQTKPSGLLTFTVPVEQGEQVYRIEVLAPGGSVEGDLKFFALRDQIAPEVSLDLPPPRATSDAVLHMQGSAGDALSLTLNGTALPLTEGRFDLSVTLSAGKNEFELVATDAVGNVQLTNLTTLYDIDPPDVLSVDVRRPKGAAGPIELEVQAQDASGLRQAAPFVLSIDGNERDGFLRCDTSSGLCRAVLPPEPGEIEIIELIIEDYAGNAAFE
jgi:Glucodextranase, domain B/FecR protein